MSGKRIIALIVALAGIAWFLQGVGVFTAIDSFMNFDVRWAIIGIGMMIMAILIWNWKPRS